MDRSGWVQSAISHWAPRLVANGVPLTDFQEITAGLSRWEDWCPAWSARAAAHEVIGLEALERGFGLSAGEHLTTAALCYHFGKFLFVNDPEQMRTTHQKAVECRSLALPHLRPPGERVEIPYQGGFLAGILRRPPEVTRPPVVVLVMGLDSAKEEMGNYEATFLARGMATLAFDGPGQGEAEYDLPIRGDYEVPVKAVLDWVSGRDELDPERIGLWGVSMGGYYAPRAAAFESRVKACISLSGPFDLHAAWEGVPEITREAFRVRSHSATADEARERARALSLEGIAHQIACPIFIVAGRLDRVIPPGDAERLAAEVSGPATLLMIEDGNHVANNRGYRYRNQSADWMAVQLGAGGA